MTDTDKINLTVKVRLYPTREQANEFKSVTNTFKDVCNLVSQWYFDKHFRVNRNMFQNEMYYDIREQYPELNAQMVQSTFRCVNARYKTVKTQLQQKTYHYKDVNTNKWCCVHKNLEWLQKPIQFKRPQADYLRTGNYSFVQNKKLISMNVLGKRIKVKYNINYVNPLINMNAKFGTAKLVNFERKFKTKAQTRDLHSWSFYDFQQKLTYKALLNQSTVITVPAQYTSQRCPKCAQITKSARNHDIHQYHCPHCSFTTNDDRIGAMNLYELGKEYLNGNKHPKFTK